MDKPHILVVEDDASVCELLYSSLSKAGYRVTVALSGEAALALIEEDLPQAVILDLNLPGMNGLDVCRTLRRDAWMSKIPVLMLTGQSEEDDVVTGLEVGADDYMTKPFSPKLLTARIHALLRRGTGFPAPSADEDGGQSGTMPELLIVKTLGKCELQVGDRNLSWAEDFSPAQRQLMSMLVASAQAKISQEVIQAALWPESSAKKARSSFDSLLSRVRRSLDDTLAPFDSKQYLVAKRGYLCLEHAKIDAHEFRRLVRKGHQQVGSLEYWPAEITFSSAFSLWQGTFVPGGFGTDLAITYQDELEQLYLDATLSFASLLAENRRFKQAEKLVREALRYDTTNDNLVRLLYQLCLAQKSAGMAGQVLKQYRETLAKEGYSALEIEEIFSHLPENQVPGDWLPDQSPAASKLR